MSGQFRGGLYDTKHICRQLPALGSDTSLGVMFRSLAPQPPGQGEPAEGEGERRRGCKYQPKLEQTELKRAEHG